jgi:hypothetical protein
LESYKGFRLSVVARMTQLDWFQLPSESNILTPRDEIEFPVNVLFKSVYIVTRAVAYVVFAVNKRIVSGCCRLMALK